MYVSAWQVDILMGQNFPWNIWRDVIKVFRYFDSFFSCGLKNRFRKIIFSLVGLIKMCLVKILVEIIVKYNTIKKC